MNDLVILEAFQQIKHCVLWLQGPSRSHGMYRQGCMEFFQDFCEHVAVQAASLVTFPHRWQYKCRTSEVETGHSLLLSRNCM
jgi:hypothetical protein